MTDAEIRSIFKNDSVIARRIDGDDSDHEDSDLHSPRSSLISTDSETLVPSIHSSSSRGYNTGPKGVREDARAFREDQARYAAEKRGVKRDKESKLGQAGTWADDEDARERWVEKRMKELSKVSTTTTAGTTTTTGGRQLKPGLEAADALEYLEIVEGNPFVIVCIYDADSESTLIIDALSGLPGRYPHYKFILLDKAEADMDAAAVPALLYYENSNLEKSIMRVPDEISSTVAVTRESLEAVLIRHGILK